MHAGSGIAAHPVTSQFLGVGPLRREFGSCCIPTAAVQSEMIGRWTCKISGIQNHLPLMQVVWKIKKDCRDCRRFGDE